MIRPAILMTAPMHPAVTARLGQRFALHRLWEQDDPEAFLTAHGAAIRGIATSTLYGRVDDTLFSRLPALEIVASFGVGYDNVDAQAAAARGIVGTNTPGGPDADGAEFPIGLLAATIRTLPQAERVLRHGGWHQRTGPRP